MAETNEQDIILDYTDDPKKVEAAIEAILFATGEAVAIADLSKVMSLPTEAVRERVKALAAACEEAGRGVQIIFLEDAVQMCTRKDYYGALIRYELQPRKPRLTDVMLETLSVIAYRQPVTKAEIERIRGVNSDHAVNRLLEYGLVKELGRAKLPGRPLLFGTTEEFLRRFGISSREDLPEISAVMVEDFKSEAESEAGVSVEV